MLFALQKKKAEINLISAFFFLCVLFLSFEPVFGEPLAGGFVEELQAGPSHKYREEEEADSDHNVLSHWCVSVCALPAHLCIDHRVVGDIDGVGEVAEEFAHLHRAFALNRATCAHQDQQREDNQDDKALVQTIIEYPTGLVAQLSKMANLASVTVVEEKDPTAQAFIVKTTQYFVPMSESIDVEAELEKLAADEKYYEGFLRFL